MPEMRGSYEVEVMAAEPAEMIICPCCDEEVAVENYSFIDGMCYECCGDWEDEE